MIINNLPKVFVSALLLAWITFWFLPELINELVLRLGTYTPYALAAVVIFLGDVVLCSRGDEEGKVSVWLVTRTYAQLGWSLTLWGFVGLVVAIFIYPELEGIWILKQASYSLVGGGMAMEVLAAVIMVWGLRSRGRLLQRIHPTLFRHSPRRKRGRTKKG